MSISPIFLIFESIFSQNYLVSGLPLQAQQHHITSYQYSVKQINNVKQINSMEPDGDSGLEACEATFRNIRTYVKNLC